MSFATRLKRFMSRPWSASIPDPRTTAESLNEIAWPNYTKTWLRLKENAKGRAKANDDEIQQLIAAKEKDREYRKRKFGFTN
jgi:hypothetical protein